MEKIVKEKEPTISVILPIFNAQDYIRCIISQILSQNFNDIEIICVDDGSQDNSLEILNELKKTNDKLVIISKPNEGVSSARNAGLDIAKGRYIAFVDVDDQIDNSFISYLYNLIKQNNTQLAICSYNFFDNNGKILNRKAYYETVDCVTYFNQQQAIAEITQNYSKFCGHVWDKLFIRNLIGDLRFKREIYNCEDTLFCYQYILKCNKIVLGPEIHYLYIQNVNSITHNKYSEKINSSFLAWELIFNSLNGNLKEKLGIKIAKDIINHEIYAMKSLPKAEQCRFKDRFIELSYEYFPYNKKLSYKQRIISFFLNFYFKHI